MRPNEIAELRKDPEPNQFVALKHTQLLRLIDERAILLAALRDIVAWEDGVQDAKDWRQFLDAARIAIATADK